FTLAVRDAQTTADVRAGSLQLPYGFRYVPMHVLCQRAPAREVPPVKHCQRLGLDQKTPMLIANNYVSKLAVPAPLMNFRVAHRSGEAQCIEQPSHQRLLLAT